MLTHFIEKFIIKTTNYHFAQMIVRHAKPKHIFYSCLIIKLLLLFGFSAIIVSIIYKQINKTELSELKKIYQNIRGFIE
jgi:hypothetical protein